MKAARLVYRGRVEPESLGTAMRSLLESNGWRPVSSTSIASNNGTTQVYEKVNPESLADLEPLLDWTDLKVYDINVAGRNHGILLGTKGWAP